MGKEKNERVCIQLLHAILALKSYSPSIKKKDSRLCTIENPHKQPLQKSI